jgi:hypothetical protein
MLTNIPLANFYQISSYEAPAAPIAVGGLMMMNEVGTMLEDEDIVIEMGYTDDECFLLVNRPYQVLTDIVDKARLNVDNALKSKEFQVDTINE